MSEILENNIYQHPACQKHQNILSVMKKERIFDVTYIDKEFYISEMCDEYFEKQLTKSDCLELAALFADIARSMI